MKIVRIFRDKTFEQGGDNIEGTNAVDKLRVEVLHFLAVAFMQNLQARASFCVGFSAVTGSAEKKKKS